MPNISPRYTACHALLLHDLRKLGPQGLTEPEMAVLYETDYASVRTVVQNSKDLLTKAHDRRPSRVYDLPNISGKVYPHDSFSLNEDLAFSGSQFARERRALEKGVKLLLGAASNEQLAAVLRGMLGLKEPKALLEALSGKGGRGMSTPTSPEDINASLLRQLTDSERLLQGMFGNLEAADAVAAGVKAAQEQLQAAAPTLTEAAQAGESVPRLTAECWVCGGAGVEFDDANVQTPYSRCGEDAPPAAARMPAPADWSAAAEWLRNNYQDHPNIASLCDAMRAYGYSQEGGAA